MNIASTAGLPWTLAIAATTALVGCGSGGEDPKGRAALREIAVTASAPAELLAEIALGPDRVERLGLAADPAEWSPSDADLSAIVTARRVVLLGAEFEPWAQRAGLPPSRTVTLGDVVAQDALLATATMTHTHGKGPAHSHGGIVSTIWTDPGLLRVLVHEAGERLAPALVGAEGDERQGREAAQGAIQRRTAFQGALAQYEAALTGLKNALAGRRLLAVQHGLEYVARAAEAPVQVALLEIQASGERNDHAASELTEAAAAGGHAGVLVWVGEPDPAFAQLASEELGLTSVPFDLGSAGEGSSLLPRLTASVQRLTAAVRGAQGK